MSTRYDPFKDETLGTPAEPPLPKKKRRPATRFDWKAVARRLAEGERPAAIAAGGGPDEDRIWRHMKRSLRFRFYIRQALERQRLLAELQLGAAGPAALVSRSRQADSLDGETLRLLEAAGDEAAPNLAQQVEQLGETGGPPPNMALRKRIAAEKRQMDAFVAGSVALLKAHEAGRAGMDAGGQQRALADSHEPQRAPVDASGHQRTGLNDPRPSPLPPAGEGGTRAAGG